MLNRVQHDGLWGPSVQDDCGLSARSHLLIDRAEDGVAGLVLHPDADPVARLEEGRRRPSVEDRLDGADFRKAGIAAAGAVDRRAGAAVGAPVRNRARADDRAGAEIAGPGEM